VPPNYHSSNQGCRGPEKGWETRLCSNVSQPPVPGLTTCLKLN
jgi:hypothetical protein